MSEQETTGHEWDGIRELNTPLPRWWLWTFYLTILWGIGYCIAYPAIPLVTGNTAGLLGYSSRGELEQTMAMVADERREIFERIASSDLATIRGDEELAQFAIAGGAAAFRVHCSQCHGSGAVGSAGYPNLNDDDWIWGGSLEEIHQTISAGVRDETNDDSRFSEMPAFGTDGILEAADIRDVTAHLLALGGREPVTGDAGLGGEIYADQCAVCHGEGGEGMRDLGAPALADAIWLYGSDPDSIMAQVRQPSHGVMPAWGARLGDTVVKQLTLYVHSLGGGE